MISNYNSLNPEIPNSTRIDGFEKRSAGALAAGFRARAPEPAKDTILRYPDGGTSAANADIEVIL